jgi:hypothetical protein
VPERLSGNGFGDLSSVIALVCGRVSQAARHKLRENVNSEAPRLRETEEFRERRSQAVDRRNQIRNGQKRLGQKP